VHFAYDGVGCWEEKVPAIYETVTKFIAKLFQTLPDMVVGDNND